MHELFMRRCVELATQGLGHVAPNPMVGAVIVHEGKIIGEGFHREYGKAHAEVNAVNAVLTTFPNGEDLLRQSTLYVSLEPCAHFGKTPPCADLITGHGIPKVVIGCRDSFKQVAGKGIEKLKAAGTEVIVDVLHDECRELNKRFFTYHEKKRPYVILKWAQTPAGFFAPKTGGQFWITNDTSRKLVHKWRSEEQAILIGTETARIDNPELTVRYWKGSNPVRVVIDKELKLSTNLKVFNHSAKTIIINHKKSAREGNLLYIKIEEGDYLAQMILYQLYLLDIQSLIIEGGASTLNAFIKAGLWDEARIFTGIAELKDGIKAPKLNGQLLSESMIDADHLMMVKNPNA